MMELVDMRDLGSRALRVGSSPTTRTTSEQALYRLLRFFVKIGAHSCRCSSFPNRTRSAGLRFGLPRLVGCIFFVNTFHVGASFISLAPIFLR